MNRFVIVDGLPYLFASGKTYTVRWDEKGFTVGAEVKLASVPSSPVTYSDLSIQAKCAGHLNSIDVLRPEAPDLESMTIAQLKAYAEDKSIDLGEATKKAEILAVIKGRENA